MSPSQSLRRLVGITSPHPQHPHASLTCMIPIAIEPELCEHINDVELQARSVRWGAMFLASCRRLKAQHLHTPPRPMQSWWKKCEHPRQGSKSQSLTLHSQHGSSVRCFGLGINRISCSTHGSQDRNPSSIGTAGWDRPAESASKPVTGRCYGHSFRQKCSYSLRAVPARWRML